MSLKQSILRVVPSSIKTRVKHSLDTKKLNSLKPLTCDTKNLMPLNGLSSAALFNSAALDASWNEAKKEIERFSLPDGTGGVNPGDRRAIFYLLRKFRSLSVLEAGTHIGASTVHIASALDKNKKETNRNISFTTVDIRDVNSTVEKPWLEYGTRHSPAEMINELKYGSFVNFVKGTSFSFFATNKQKFDFIFLDGDHSAPTVYQEIPLALKALNPNGIILLHDYYPDGKALWSVDNVIDGPCMATQRFIKEAADLVVLPLGDLPWPTKLNSNITSLALLMRKSS